MARKPHPHFTLLFNGISRRDVSAEMGMRRDQERITITFDDALTAELDAHMAAVSTTSRSEAIRNLIGRGLSTIPFG